MRPICPDCGDTMIYMAVPVNTVEGGEVVSCWVCDCRNAYLADDIEEARADASPDASLCLDFVVSSTNVSNN